MAIHYTATEYGNGRSRDVDPGDLKNVLLNWEGISGVVFRLLEYHTTAKIVLHGFAPLLSKIYL